MKTLSIARDFSRTPGARYVKEGEYSGQVFRENVLLGAVLAAQASNEKLVVDLDGTAGYGSSFLEESFGGLVREEGLSADDLIQMLEFKCEDAPELIDQVRGYIVAAGKPAR